MICDKCKKHIERKFLSKGKTINCLNYACERPYIKKGFIECTRNEICDYIYKILQPERLSPEGIYHRNEDGTYPPPQPCIDVSDSLNQANK